MSDTALAVSGDRRKAPHAHPVAKADVHWPNTPRATDLHTKDELFGSSKQPIRSAIAADAKHDTVKAMLAVAAAAGQWRGCR